MDITIAIIAIIVLAGISLFGRRRGVSPEQMARLAESVNNMRAASEQEQKYHPIPRLEGPDVPGGGYYDATSRELGECGCRELGDLKEEKPDGTLTGAARWFVDGTGTIAGWFSVLIQANGSAKQIMMVFCESANGDYYSVNRGGVDRGTAQPPMIKRALCPWSDGMAKQLEMLRGLVPASQAATLTQVTSLDEATSLLTRLQAAKAKWRAAQPADALLDLDLRAILRERYDELGPKLKAYLLAQPRKS
jgi:hypothetical protein